MFCFSFFCSKKKDSLLFLLITGSGPVKKNMSSLIFENSIYRPRGRVDCRAGNATTVDVYTY